MLLIGPPGSGKTTRALQLVAVAVDAGRSEEIKVLVPTASMKNHLIHVLAKRELMVPGDVVSTLSEFVRDATPGLREAGGAVADRLLRGAIERSARGEFVSRSGSTGLRNRLSALTSEFWAAGADNLQIESAVRNRRQRAFQAVFQAYEESLEAAGFVHHNQRIARAAAAIRQKGLGPIRTVYVDGFDRFTKQQEELLEALEEQAEELLIAMPDQLPRYPLDRSKAEYLPSPGGSGAAVEIFEASSPRAEILEIARLILESGRPLHEHGIVIRSLEQYEPLVREVFGTLGIPFRVWAQGRLVNHGVARHFLAWLRAIDRRFPGEQVLEVLNSPLTPAGSTAERDVFDFAARELLPNSGLDFLRTLAERDEGPGGFLDGLRPQADWCRRRYGAKRWARECLEILPRLQCLPVPVDAESFDRTRNWRAAIQAQRALRGAIEETAGLPEFQGRRRISLGAFADALEDVTRSTAVTVSDLRFEVVHVLPVGEARQWSIPVTFACGLVEGWFPRRFSEDLLFDDADRRRMRDRGIELRTSADRADEERFLYRVATTRASERMVLSYPLRDSLGKPVMRSTLLDPELPARPAVWARIGDAGTPRAAPPVAALPDDLRSVVADCNQGFSVTGIDQFRQCPHLFFGSNTLALRGRPALPEHRLDAAQLGTIVHEALDRWNREKRSIGAILDEVFRTKLEKLNLGESCRTEQLRLALRSDLVRFAGEPGASMAIYEGARAFFENDRQYRINELESKPVVRCRIDRYDMDDSQRCFVTDYKYARPDRVRTMLKEHLEGDRLQLWLYLAALEQELRCTPAGMALCGLRGATSYIGASIDGTGGLSAVTDEELGSLIDQARSQAAEAVGGVLHGWIAVQPRDTEFCDRYCGFRSVCRVKWPDRGPDGRSIAGKNLCN